jgi:beta-N-acetylhexosaminidase
MRSFPVRLIKGHAPRAGNKLAAGACIAAAAAIIGAGCIVTALLTSASAPAPVEKARQPDFWDAGDHEQLAKSIVNDMTDGELLSQILMFGWAGEDPSPLVTDWVEKRGLGSIKVFGWNTDNTLKVAQSISILQKKAETNRFHIPLFVATDQEGGWIRHIKGRTTETPGNLAIGASGLPSDAWYSGYYIARELRAIGVNLNFAPTVDLYTDHESTVIGPRSFGEDPESAGVLGASFVAGSRAAGVLTTAKHYPGHGDTGSDSHGRLPVIDISEKTLDSRELVPFRYLVEAQVPAIMSGHLSFPRIVGNGAPATFSKYLLNDVLRGQLGFTGLIITDDMMMNGATSWAGSISQAVRMAIEAGNDIIESSTTPAFDDALWEKNIGRMKESADFRARVADAAERVIKAKLDYFKGTNPVPIQPDIAKVEKLVPDPEGQKFFLSQAVRSVTIVRDKGIPWAPGKNEKVLLAGNFPAFLEAGKKRVPGADTSPVNAELYGKTRGYDTVIFCLASRDNLAVLKDLQWRDARVIVISSLSPVLLEDVPWVKTAIAVYSYSPASFTAAFGALAGDFAPTGNMPLTGIR